MHNYNTRPDRPDTRQSVCAIAICNEKAVAISNKKVVAICNNCSSQSVIKFEIYSVAMRDSLQDMKIIVTCRLVNVISFPFSLSDHSQKLACLRVVCCYF